MKNPKATSFRYIVCVYTVGDYNVIIFAFGKGANCYGVAVQDIDGYQFMETAHLMDWDSAREACNAVIAHAQAENQ